MLLLCNSFNVWRPLLHLRVQASRTALLGCLLVPSKQVSYLGKWETPSGYDSGISVYNSAAGKRVPLILQRKDIATWYMCGPTVYAESHIGHACCYVKFDIIRRILENVFSINVICLLGITDIDDKIINKANESGVNASEVAKKYELDFFEDLHSLNVLPPSAVVRVTENISAIVEFIEKLIDKDYAYATSEGDVYFMVSKGTTADVLQEMPEEEPAANPLKRDHRDFALWKAAKPKEPSWESPWGTGRPGWHIECSAMASKMFGSKLDLHSGGYDLLFPHHANEKSQSEAYHGCSQWVNYWLHAGLLHIDDDLKMSKSLKNTISIKEFLSENTVNDFRIFCLQSLYRKNICYNEETLSQAKSLLSKLHNFINDCELYINGDTSGPVRNPNDLLAKLDSTKEKVNSSFKSDFNTGQALLDLIDLIDDVNKSLPIVDSSTNDIVVIFPCYSYVRKVLEMLGVSIFSKKKLPGSIVHCIDAAVGMRNCIRNFALNPAGIDLGEDTFVQYVDSCYQNFRRKTSNYLHSEKKPICLDKIQQESCKFHSEVLAFAQSFDNQTGLKSLKHMPPDVAKRTVKSLFKLCDSFRLGLSNSGVSIKDRGSNSPWIPLIELDKMLQQKSR